MCLSVCMPCTRGHSCTHICLAVCRSRKEESSNEREQSRYGKEQTLKPSTTRLAKHGDAMLASECMHGRRYKWRQGGLGKEDKRAESVLRQGLRQGSGVRTEEALI
eukprot:6210216-Pleurochrysis_carterae.AAC.3